MLGWMMGVVCAQESKRIGTEWKREREREREKANGLEISDFTSEHIFVHSYLARPESFFLQHFRPMTAVHVFNANGHMQWTQFHACNLQGGSKSAQAVVIVYKFLI